MIRVRLSASLTHHSEMTEGRSKHSLQCLVVSRSQAWRIHLPGGSSFFLPNGDPLLEPSAQGIICSAGSTALARATPPGSLLCLYKDNAVFISTPLNSTHIAKTEWEEQEGGRKK